MDERKACPPFVREPGTEPGQAENCSGPSGTVVLVRQLPGMCGEARRTIHLVPVEHGSGDLTAYCGLRIRPETVEVLDRFRSMPCETCLVLASSRHTRVVHSFRPVPHRLR